MTRSTHPRPRVVCAGATLFAALLAGCATPHDRATAPVPRSADQFASDRSFRAPAGDWPHDDWWRQYRDPQLDALIEAALREAPTIAVTRARLDQARAAAAGAAGARAPQVGLNSSVAAQKLSSNYLTPAALTPDGFHGYGRVTLDLAFDADLWGRLRAALAAATSEADASQADLAQARLVLAASIASGWAELARLHAALETTTTALDVRTQTVDLLTRRFDNGLETRASVRQAAARRASAALEKLQIDEQIALQQHALAALAGLGPDAGLDLGRPSVAVLHGFALPPSLSADLLGRRPDVAAARLRVEAAGSRIRQARAAFYPDVNLLASVGLQSLGLGALARGGSSIASIGPAVSLPIFEGGRLDAQLRGANAGYDQAVGEYERTLVGALQEVANVTVSQQALGDQLARADDAVGAAREAWSSQQDRYRGGLANYLEVLTAEDTLVANLRTQTDLQSRSFALDVSLIRALGGGYTAPRS